MGLIMNLDGAVQEINKAQSNIEVIEAINRFTEEFYKTLSILLYIRYRKHIRENQIQICDDTTNLVQDYFQKPTFDSWMKLAQNCYTVFSQTNDPFVERLNKSLNKQFPQDSAENIRQIVIDIYELKSSSIDTPRKIQYGWFLEKMRELRNFRAHHWDNNTKLDPLVKHGIKNAVITTVSDIFDNVEIKIVKPENIQREHINTYHWDSCSGTFSRIQISEISILPGDLAKTYVVFPDEEDVFLNPTNLINLDDKEDRIYVYGSMQSDHSAYFTSLPRSGGIKEEKLSFNGHEEVFSLSQVEMKKDLITLTLKQKFGQIRQDRGIIHNFPDLCEYYVGRPKKELELLERLKHRRVFYISLSGGGGYGKTELVKKVVWDVIRGSELEKKDDDPRYDLAVWISAKETKFEKGKINEFTAPFHNLEDFLNCILYVTNNIQYIDHAEESKKSLICEILNCHEATLLVIDNLETIADKNSLWVYLDGLLNDVEKEIKIIITSRVDDYTFGQYVIPVGSMEDDEARQLISEQLDRLGLLNRYSNQRALKQIADISAKSPLLIIFVVQLLARGYTLEELSKGGIQAYEQALNFICDFQWRELSDLAKDILMAVTIANGMCSFSQVRQMCNIVDNADFLSAKEELTQRSFIVQSELENSVLSLLPPIHAFVKYKLIEYPHKEEDFTTQWKILNLGLDQRSKDSTQNIVFPCDADEIHLRQLIQKAESFIRIGSITYAHDYYTKCVQFFPENAIAWRELAEFEFKFLEDDDKARSSFQKAIECDPGNPITYTKRAYWEQLRGTEQQIAQYILNSIRCNKKALLLYTDERSKRTVQDHIGSSYLKLGEIEKNFGQLANYPDKQDHFVMADEYVKLAIKIFEDNIIDQPQNDDDRYHNAIDYNYLAQAYTRVARGDQKNADYYYQKALVCLVKGFESKSDYDRLLYTLGDHNIKRILRSRYNIIVDNVDRNVVRAKVVNIAEKIEDDFSKMRLKV